jgi:hypothetical protein
LYRITSSLTDKGTPLHVGRTPGISCEAVRTDAKRRSARIGTSVCHRANTSFVSFIPLFDGAAALLTLRQKRSAQPSFGIIETNAGGTKRLRVERSTQPLTHSLELLVLRIEDNLQQTRITVDTAAVLWRARTLAGGAAWVHHALLPRADGKQLDIVLPTIPKVVGVFR